MNGLYVLGAELSPGAATSRGSSTGLTPEQAASAVSHRAVIVQVRNATQLAQKQGLAASLAAALAPETIENKVLDTIRSKISDAMKKEGVDAAVAVVEPANWQPLNGERTILTTVAVTATGGLVAMLVWNFLRKKRVA
jgi:hypothetical protein